MYPDVYLRRFYLAFCRVLYFILSAIDFYLSHLTIRTKAIENLNELGSLMNLVITEDEKKSTSKCI